MANSGNADAKKRARALVAQVKQRVARQEGTSPPEGTGEDGMGASDATAGQDGEVEGMEARGAQAKGVRTQKALAKSHLTRAQGHAAARTQRTQARREGK